jgi:hypothetical protein
MAEDTGLSSGSFGTIWYQFVDGVQTLVPGQNGSSKMAESNMDGNSLIAALAGDASQVGTAFIAADAAKSAVKANPGSATTLIIVVGAGIALVAIVFLLKK